MKKIALVFGSIAGVICAGMLLITNPDMMDENAALVGYTTMVIALSTIFFGIKMHRDKHLGGNIKFGRAFLLGIYISLVASFIYSAGWEVTMAMNDVEPMTYMQQYAEIEANKAEKNGATPEEVKKAGEDVLAQWGWYANPILRFLWTMLFEMFVVGVVVSLICAGILKNKNVLSAKSAA